MFHGWWEIEKKVPMGHCSYMFRERTWNEFETVETGERDGGYVVGMITHRHFRGTPLLSSLPKGAHKLQEKTLKGASRGKFNPTR